jgi:hypothetical protein
LTKKIRVLALAEITAPVWIVVAGTIFIGILVGSGLQLIDNKIGASDYMKSTGARS